MANVKEFIDFALSSHYQKAKLIEDDKTRLGYLQALDDLTLFLDISLSVGELEDLLDYEHDSVFYLNDRRLYRLDTVSDAKGPFIEPLVPGYGGKKRYAQGTSLNGLFPGVMLSAPNYRPKA